MNKWGLLRGEIKVRTVFITMLGLAVFLPLLVTTTLNPESIRFISKANSIQPLRIWLEPANIIAQPGETVQLAVMAEFDDMQNVIPGVRLSLLSDEGLELVNTNVDFPATFRGKAILGNVTVRAVNSGEKKIWIDQNSVDTQLPNLEVQTTESKITIK